MSLSRETTPGDLVLIQSDGKPAGFARVEAIRAHELEGWYHCDLLLLAIPPRPITWILERAQIDGADFTMSGQPIRLERLPDLGVSHEAAAEPGEPEVVNESSPGDSDGTDGSDGTNATGKDSPERSSKVVDLFPRS
jgi:hypothetical protein